ncbi:hypothetical protein CDAR_276731 [Caerostris darwini]|uniref:Uncharacterized protein n=1 Tax=Caerostris darwini TaxID=1538125 RepID=A0AAV4P148_9ARAC|nr:hypothetical protein CDAR_276731 [Caerostris darwini]
MTRRPERYRLDCNRRYISNAVYCDIITEARWRRERVPFGCWPMGAESRSVINGMVRSNRGDFENHDSGGRLLCIVVMIWGC